MLVWVIMTRLCAIFYPLLSADPKNVCRILAVLSIANFNSNSVQSYSYSYLLTEGLRVSYMTKMGNFSLNPDGFFDATLSVLFVQGQCCNRLLMLNKMPHVSSMWKPTEVFEMYSKILMHVHGTCLHVRQIKFLLQKFQMDCFWFIIMLIYNLYLVIVLPTCNALFGHLPTDFLVPH